MAKFTVSVWATISSRAAEMSNASSRFDNAARSCSFGSCGSNVTISVDEGSARSSDDLDRADKGRIHEVRNAETDFVV